jgi:SAM-dependent methyltransferase
MEDSMPSTQPAHATAAIAPELSPSEVWDAVAPAWSRSVEFVEHRAQRITDWLLAAGEVGAGDRVLDVGCGPGGAGLAAAARVGPSGHVVLSDVSSQMTKVAATRAGDLGLPWVSELDLDAVDLGAQPAGEYDVVLSRDGVQFAADPRQAMSGIQHVLRPGGRVAIAVWGTAEENPWLGLIMEAASDVLGRAPIPPSAPGPFALSDREGLHDLLAAAGLRAIRIEQMSAPMRPPSLEQWVDRATSLSGPLVALSRSITADAMHQIRARSMELAAKFITNGALVLPGTAVLASACRPD